MEVTEEFLGSCEGPRPRPLPLPRPLPRVPDEGCLSFERWGSDSGGVMKGSKVIWSSSSCEGSKVSELAASLAAMFAGCIFLPGA